MQLFWLCFEPPSHPPNLPFSFGDFLLSASTREVSFEWFARKRCNHRSVYWTIIPHCSGCYFTEVEERAGCNSPVFPLWRSFISSQLTNAYCLFSVHFHYCTWLKKIFTTTLWLDFYCFPHLHVKELSYIMCRKSDQVGDADNLWTRSLWVYRLWQAAVSPVVLKVSVHYLLSIRNEWSSMSLKFGFPFLSWEINTSSL